MPPISETLKATLLWMCALELLGAAGLSAVSWYFVGWSLKPVEENQRRQAEFIAAASHELRSPLAVLRSGVAALRGMMAETDKGTMQDGWPAQTAERGSAQNAEREPTQNTAPTAQTAERGPAQTAEREQTQKAAPPTPAAERESVQTAEREQTQKAAPPTPAANCEQAQYTAPPAPAASLLSAFDSECARMSRLVDDMLLLASADARTWRLRLSDVDMDTLLIDTYDSYLPLCRQKGITLRLLLPQQTLPALRCDAERIRQILAILLDNAMTYTPAGREIHISAETGVQPSKKRISIARRPSPCLFLRVADQGPGIPDEMKARVFDRFYRADSARSDKSHFGLGLSIARELTALHGGWIAVTDEEGGGSCFTVCLPLSEAGRSGN